MKKDKITQENILEIDIDSRIVYLWESLDSAIRSKKLTLDNAQIEIIAHLMRAAYGQGYSDAGNEPRGTLQRDNGYKLPPPLDGKRK